MSGDNNLSEMHPFHTSRNLWVDNLKKIIYPNKAFGDTETKDPFPSFIAIVKDTE